jgi:hypothetical protein
MERHTFSIDPLVGDRLKAIKARSGLSESEQVRRAIKLWLDWFGWPVQEREPRLLEHGEDVDLPQPEPVGDEDAIRF